MLSSPRRYGRRGCCSWQIPRARRPMAAVGETTVDDEVGLRGLYQQPSELAVLKQLDRLDAHCRNFLAHSPFAVIGSTRPRRGTDVNPRVAAPGLARVVDI